MAHQSTMTAARAATLNFRPATAGLELKIRLPEHEDEAQCSGVVYNFQPNFPRQQKKDFLQLEQALGADY
jgi:hypothetical protein